MSSESLIQQTAEVATPAADFAQCPRVNGEPAGIALGDGSGGFLTHRLIEREIAPQFSNPFLDQRHDGAMFTLGSARMAFSTDSFVVSPAFFPGGDIGTLAVNGTVNNLAMCGARPQWLSAGFILEEGFPIDGLRRIVRSMKAAAGAADVTIVTGDIKVVDRGKGDGIYINTSGVGIIRNGVRIDPGGAAPGDSIIVSGPIAMHGTAVMSVRGKLPIEPDIISDCAPLHGLVETVLDACPSVRVLRDPTRGGVATALSEIADQSRVGMVLDESAIPVTEPVRRACKSLGLDPLCAANEGKFLAIVPGHHAGRVLEAMHGHPLGSGAAIIGTVVREHPRMILMNTAAGGTRMVEAPVAGQPSRIC